MRPIIRKAAIILDKNPLYLRISSGDPAFLSLNPDITISAWVERPSRLPFGLGRPKIVSIGKLESQATHILHYYLEHKAKLRVRIIEIEPAHISSTGNTTIYVSVWGNSDKIYYTKRTSAATTHSMTPINISSLGFISRIRPGK